MADSKITALTSISTSTDPANDPLVIVDVSDTSMAATGTTKKVTLNQLLGASGTATLASATITGDLTVDTSTLKVDSANNRVGIQITSPTAPLEVGETSGTALRLRRLTSGNTIDVNFYNTNTTVGDVAGIRCDGDGLANTFGAISFWTTQTPNSLVERYRISSVGVHTWQNVGGVAGTAMTLNSTGLGVGVSPSALLHVQKSQNSETTAIINNTNTGTSAGVRLDLQSNSSNYLTLQSYGQNYSGNAFGIAAAKLNVVSENSATAFSSGLAIGTTSSNPLYFATSNAVKMTLDASGNVGIGVTPSAWSTLVPALQLGGGGTFLAARSTNPEMYIGTNAHYNGANWIYKTSSAASKYSQDTGAHRWFTAPSGTAGNAITFTQAMTLTAGGDLLVGKTATGVGTVGNEIKAVGEFYSTQSASTNANFTYHVYSTGAAAYRFYVGLGGTVYATNTTISAISDARLKENVQDIDVGLDAILALKPRKFDWKNGKGKNIKGDRGFIAQEFETVFPNLVDEWKDPAPEGEAPYKSVRQDLIPVLVKAIQELTARVQTLETR